VSVALPEPFVPLNSVNNYVAVHQATSIEEIAEAIVTEENEKGDDNIDIDDEPVVPKISISKALSAANDLTYFFEQENPSSYTQDQLNILRNITRDLTHMYNIRRTQQTLDAFLK